MRAAARVVRIVGQNLLRPSRHCRSYIRPRSVPPKPRSRSATKARYADFLNHFLRRIARWVQQTAGWAVLLGRCYNSAPRRGVERELVPEASSIKREKTEVGAPPGSTGWRAAANSFTTTYRLLPHDVRPACRQLVVRLRAPVFFLAGSEPDNHAGRRGRAVTHST